MKSVGAQNPIGYGRNHVTAKDSRIATVSIGYPDGIPRSLSEVGWHVLIRGQKAKIVGNICMDQCMIDVTHVDGVEEGDIVTLIGEEWEERVTAAQMTSRCRTITNEIVSGVGRRVERV